MLKECHKIVNPRVLPGVLIGLLTVFPSADPFGPRNHYTTDILSFQEDSFRTFVRSNRREIDGIICHVPSSMVNFLSYPY